MIYFAHQKITLRTPKSYQDSRRKALRRRLTRAARALTASLCTSRRRFECQTKFNTSVIYLRPIENVNASEWNIVMTMFRSILQVYDNHAFV